MKANSKQQNSYVPPCAEVFTLSKGFNVLSTMSIYGDVHDYEEGGIYEGTTTNTSTFTNF